jgi:hypothetical protein
MKTLVVFFRDYALRRSAPLPPPGGAPVMPLNRKAQEKAAIQVAENEGMPPARG